MNPHRMAVFTCSAQSGATISAKNGVISLLRGGYLQPHDVDVYYTFSLRKRSVSLDSDVLRELESVGVSLYPIILPEEIDLFRMPQLEKKKNRLSGLIKRNLGNIVYSTQFLNPLKTKYDIFWINQLPYCSILRHSRQISKFIFAREIIYQRDGRGAGIIDSIGHLSNGIIAIDDLTAQPFLPKFGDKLRTFRNPVDMELGRTIRISVNDKKKFKAENKIPPGKRLIALIGNITPLKGPEFFLDIARSFQFRDDCFFLLVGAGDFPGNEEYCKNIVAEAEKIGNIRVLSGDEIFVQYVYGVVDLSIRCDAFFPLGRTVWESLYSGVPSLLPMRKSDDTNEVSDYLGKQVFLYDARDKNSVSNVLNNLLGKLDDLQTLTVSGNMDEYGKELWGFMKSRM